MVSKYLITHIIPHIMIIPSNLTSLLNLANGCLKISTFMMSAGGTEDSRSCEMSASACRISNLKVGNLVIWKIFERMMGTCDITKKLNHKKPRGK